MAQSRVIVVTGPTASGKSALALALAERRGGTVINADAMQTYDAFPILTAQPTRGGARARAACALWRAAAQRDRCRRRAGATLASAEIERCLAAGRMPILCGGSGLYLRTLMQGIAAIPDVADRAARAGECRLGRRWAPTPSARGWPRRIRRSSRG